MTTLQFSILIQAPRDVVWRTMFTDATYRPWTSAFGEGSYFEGDWNTGDRIRFLAPGGSGMSSVIAESRPHEFLSIKHLGMIVNGVDDTSSEQVLPGRRRSRITRLLRRRVAPNYRSRSTS